jgi:hypothetical protein
VPPARLPEDGPDQKKGPAAASGPFLFLWDTPGCGPGGGPYDCHLPGDAGGLTLRLSQLHLLSSLCR